MMLPLYASRPASTFAYTSFTVLAEILWQFSHDTYFYLRLIVLVLWAFLSLAPDE